MSESVPSEHERETSLLRSNWIVTATFLVCAVQIAWFWRYCGRNISADGICYIGLARHLRDGDFISSLHGYWSPFISWLIAMARVLIPDWTLAGRVVTIATLLAIFPLSYLLSYRLWNSQYSAAIVTLWFALARGVVAMAVSSILADFLLSAVVCIYFVLLLKCIRGNRPRDWLLLGAAHAAAFLAKAIAMPWLAVTSVLAVGFVARKSARQFATAAVLALILPACGWIGYGSLLKLKYGYFTTGYQLRYNLIVDSRRQIKPPDPHRFVDGEAYDRYLIAEASQPELHAFRLLNPKLLPIIFQNERRNLPEAIKQLVILLTPGGVLSVAIVLWRLVRYREQFASEFRFALLVMISSATLLLAYCMLVFDSRYVLPLIVPLMAIGSLPLAISSRAFARLDPGPATKKMLLGLLAAGALFFQLYWASPFRTINRDFEIPIYDAGNELKSRQPDGKTLVSVGEGPFPEHGVGREAGTYTAYFAGRRILGYNLGLPDTAGIPDLATQIIARRPDAILVWGSPTSISYKQLVEMLGHQLPQSLTVPVIDPQKGEVGAILFPASWK